MERPIEAVLASCATGAFFFCFPGTSLFYLEVFAAVFVVFSFSSTFVKGIEILPAFFGLFGPDLEVSARVNDMDHQLR